LVDQDWKNVRTQVWADRYPVHRQDHILHLDRQAIDAARKHLLSRARVAHRIAAQLSYFTTHLGRWGFELPETPAGPPLQLIARDRFMFSKASEATAHRIVLTTATCVSGR
jgi:hypothetical protein